jgi:hypothetical protein
VALREPYFMEMNMMLPSVIEEGVLMFFNDMLNQIRG